MKNKLSAITCIAVMISCSGCGGEEEQNECDKAEAVLMTLINQKCQQYAMSCNYCICYNKGKEFDSINDVCSNDKLNPNMFQCHQDTSKNSIYMNINIHFGWKYITLDDNCWFLGNCEQILTTEFDEYICY